MLKVRFAEADRGKLTAFGNQLFSTGATNTIGTISTQQFGPQSVKHAEQSSGGTQETVSIQPVGSAEYLSVPSRHQLGRDH